MADKEQINEGYQPLQKGYQPKPTMPADANQPKPQGGYTPTGAGDNPANRPAPPKSD
jgi:hypothetical protein